MTTRAEFLRMLKETTEREGLEWELEGPSGMLRCNNGHCPITATLWPNDTKGYHNASEYRESARALGLDPADVDALVICADEGEVDLTLRADLLAACGLDP